MGSTRAPVEDAQRKELLPDDETLAISEADRIDHDGVIPASHPR